jgi:ElaB/YqjD/DUF883 family membrane-anchored ribosome-binding protein
MALLARKARHATSFDVNDIVTLLRDLEPALNRLAAFVSANAREVRGAVPDRISAVPDRISEAWSDVSDRLRSTVRINARDMGEEAARMGKGVWHRIEDEVVHRPLVALAIAAGIGFVIGALNHRR